MLTPLLLYPIQQWYEGIWTTKGRERPPNNEKYKVQVRAKNLGVAPNGEPNAAQVQYNIGMQHIIFFKSNSLLFCLVLETLFYGAPYDVFKIGVFVAFLCIFIVSILVPQIFPRLGGLNQLN